MNYVRLMRKIFQFCFCWTSVCLTVNLALLVTSLMHLAPWLRLLIHLKLPKQRYWEQIWSSFPECQKIIFLRVVPMMKIMAPINQFLRLVTLETFVRWPLTQQPKPHHHLKETQTLIQGQFCIMQCLLLQQWQNPRIFTQVSSKYFTFHCGCVDLICPI